MPLSYGIRFDRTASSRPEQYPEDPHSQGDGECDADCDENGNYGHALPPPVPTQTGKEPQLRETCHKRGQRKTRRSRRVHSHRSGDPGKGQAGPVMRRANRLQDSGAGVGLLPVSRSFSSLDAPTKIDCRPAKRDRPSAESAAARNPPAAALYEVNFPSRTVPQRNLPRCSFYDRIDRKRKLEY